MSQTAPRILIGASIPRSGHHFLQSMLKACLGPQLHYCEFYKPAGCCHAVPCTRRGAFSVVFQKNHDFEHQLAQDIPGATYVVQYRHPVPEALSDRELDLREHVRIVGLDYRRTREHYMGWLARKAVYFRRFHDRWVAPELPQAIRLDYDALTRDPEAALAGVIERVASPADPVRIREAVERIAGHAVGTGNQKPFRPRVAEESPNFDRDLLGAFEAQVLSQCPAFGYERMIPEGRIAGHPMTGLILAFDEQMPLPPGWTDRLQAAVQITGEHPDLMLRLARREAEAGEHATAIARLRALLRRHPDFTLAWWPLLQSCRASNAPTPPELVRADTLLTLTRRPELLAQAGELLLAAGRVMDAIGVLAIATTLLPAHLLAHRLMARALEAAGRRGQAKAFADKADALGAEQPPARRVAVAG